MSGLESTEELAEENVEENAEEEIDLSKDVKGTTSIVLKITDFCNNKCAHCCFSCSPKNTEFMTLETAQKVNNTFVDDDTNVYWLNLMGGEPTLHKTYEDIVNVFDGRMVRFVTNGWWVDNPAHKKRFMKFLETTKAIVHVGVSRDQYHPKGVGQKAFQFLQDNEIADDWGLTTPDPEEEDSSLASVGRAYHNSIGYMRSSFGCYCHSSNTRNESVTILEDGTVTHCPFGIYPLAMLEDGIEKIKKEKARMVGVWREIGSCRSCYQMWEFQYRVKAIGLGYDIYNKTSL